MDKDVIDKIVMYLTLAIVCYLLLIFGEFIGVTTYQKEAVKRGYAQHNHNTGNFEWIEKVGK